MFQLRHAAVLKMVKDLLLPKNAFALEVGCGAGLATVELARLGYIVQAVDPVKNMLNLTRHNAAEAEVSDKVSPCLGDVCNLHFAENTFDLVIAVGVLQWLSAPRGAVLEMKRVAKSGGYLIMTFLNSWELGRILDPLRNPLLFPIRALAKRVLGASGFYDGDRKPANQAAQMDWYSIKDFESLVASQGLEPIQVTTVGFEPFTYFGKRVLSDSSDLLLHEKLRPLVDAMRLFPILRLSLGGWGILLARKTRELE